MRLLDVVERRSIGNVRAVLRSASASSGVNARSACWTRLPSWARTDDGTSVGAWVTKYTPTPLERISRAVRSICSISASDASSNSRWASSKKKHSLGLGRSPTSGSDLVQLGQHPEHERGEQARLVHDVGQLEEADDAGAVGRRPQQVGRRRTRARRRRCRRLPARARRSSATAHPTVAGRHPAVVGKERLALVRRQVLATSSPGPSGRAAAGRCRRST